MRLVELTSFRLQCDRSSKLLILTFHFGQKVEYYGTTNIDQAKKYIMSTGIVKFFNAEKGFGFILQDDGGKDLFVHASEIQGGRDTILNEGQKVKYEIGEGRKGPCATNVMTI